MQKQQVSTNHLAYRDQKTYHVGIYLRLSLEDNAEHESMSIANQRTMLVEYVTTHGWVIEDTYIDDGYSGTNFDRPGFQKMLQDIESGRINLVIVKDLSRLGRNYILCGQFTEIYFPEHGVRFIAVNDGVDTLNSNSNMDITPFKHILNDMYAKDISTKIKSVLRSKALKGEYLGAFDPYGYKRSPQDKHHLIVNDETAPIVRRIFEMCASGMGTRSISTILNNEGILSPSEYIRSQKHNPETGGEFVRESYWVQTYIRHMLKNELYIGNMVQGRVSTPSHRSKNRVLLERENWIVVPDTHEAIVTHELFARAQKALSSRQPSSLIMPNKSSPQHTGPDVLSGLFRCEACGTSMRKHRTHNGQYIYYICGKHHAQGKIACSSHYINADTIYSVILADIQRNAVLFSEDEQKATQELLSVKTSDEQRQLAKSKKDLVIAQKRFAELDGKLKRIYEDNLSGKIPDHILSIFIADYDREKASLKSKIETLKVSIGEAQSIHQDIGHFVQLIKKYTSFQQLDRFMLQQLIDKITIYETPGMGRKRNGKEKIITIHYKFVGALQ